jgi:hypothetical protein
VGNNATIGNPTVNVGAPVVNVSSQRQYQYQNAIAPAPNFSTANSFYTPPQTNYSTANSFYTPPQINTQTANSFTSAAGGVNLQTGMNNDAFTLGLAERLALDPNEYNSLPQSAKDVINQQMNGGAGGPGSVNADPANSPGGRFIQVGEVRWERNKNGRLVKVRYTGGGSWRNKEIVQGGKGGAKSRMAYEKQGGAAQPGSSNLPSFGVVNLQSLNTATG